MFYLYDGKKRKFHLEDKRLQEETSGNMHNAAAAPVA